MGKLNGTSGHTIVQMTLEALPVLPDDAWVTDLHRQLHGPVEERNGFMHTSGEWNIIYNHEGRMYRLPSSMAEVRLYNQRNFN